MVNGLIGLFSSFKSEYENLGLLAEESFFYCFNPRIENGSFNYNDCFTSDFDIY